jgi:hypothetical protein
MKRGDNMDEEEITESLAALLEENGEIVVSNSEHQISIHSSEDNFDFPYVSNTHKQFQDVNEAVEWAILQFDDVDNIEEWY